MKHNRLHFFFSAVLRIDGSYESCTIINIHMIIAYAQLYKSEERMRRRICVSLSPSQF